MQVATLQLRRGLGYATDMGELTMRQALAVVVLLALAAPAAAGACEGDCNGDREVGVEELIAGVGIALGAAPVTRCPAVDGNGDGAVAVNELVAAVDRALRGCPDPYPLDDVLRLNHAQVLGSHNSYHIEPDDLLNEAFALYLGTAAGTALANSLDYTHLPLPEQFGEQGVRQIELDVFADPLGGLYATPAGLELLTGDPEARLEGMDAPGMKVLHVQDIDWQTTCATLVGCLQLVRDWSLANPTHAPLMILIEAKDDALPQIGPFDFVRPIPIGDPELDTIDAEIRSVFAPGHVLTPDDVRGTRATLREAIEQDGWPTLRAARGKVLFALDNGGGVKDTYLTGHPSLRGRVMFTSSEPPADEAAFVKLNDPIADFDRIQALVADGYIIRTRADADTAQARSGDTTQREAALASGAQFVSSDYPVPDPDFGTGYFVAMPGGMPARCNPISAPVECAAMDIE